MKSELEYLRLALTEWCQKNRWDRQLPITAGAVLEVITIADRLRAADKKAVEDATPTA